MTLVVGRNGAGKSNFAEGGELALTGTSSRRAGRTRTWEDGWANLHTSGNRSVTVGGPTVIRREWSADAPLNA